MQTDILSTQAALVLIFSVAIWVLLTCEEKDAIDNPQISPVFLSSFKDGYHQSFCCLYNNTHQKLKLETLDSKIKQQEQLFNSGYGSEKDLLQAKIDRTTAEIELEQNKLSLAGAYYTAKFICSQE